MSKRPERRSRKTASEGITIPDRHRILAYLKSSKKPRTLQHIADNFGVRSSAARAALNNRLKAMLRDGEVIKNRREGYGLVEKMDLIAGTVMGHPDGYGFLRPDHGDEDLYLSVKEMRSLLHGDRAVVRIRGYFHTPRGVVRHGAGFGSGTGRHDRVPAEPVPSGPQVPTGRQVFHWIGHRLKTR